MRKLARAHHHPTSPDLCTRIQTHLLASPHVATVAIYAALPGEPDLSPLISSTPSLRWAFPRVTPDGLVFHLVADMSSLTPGNFGIPEPSPLLPLIPAAEIDAFLCPGLAFDPQGGRLGRGKGYYDRILQHARPDALKIGVCHAFQQVEDTFAESHDIPMHFVISG